MARKVYMNYYMKVRWRRRRQEAIDFLGGKRVKCGKTENLQFDHISPKTKTGTIARLSSASNARFWDEVKKCQLLCSECHQNKTLMDLGTKDAKTYHGTLSTYRYCKCDVCRAAKNKYMKEWKAKRNK